MKKLILSLIILSSLVLAKDTKYLGTFTIDNYPIKKCEIVKIGAMYSFVETGTFLQNRDLNKKGGLLNHLSDNNIRGNLKNKAIKQGFNAILGYKFYLNGALDTFQGNVKNGNVAFGAYTLTSQGTPVLIKCK